MNILLISIKGNSGSDVYYKRLLEGIKKYTDHNVTLHFIPKEYQFVPFLIPRYIKKHPELKGYDIVQTNIEFAHCLKGLGKKLIGVLHHNIFDKEFQKFTSIAQKMYHYGILRYHTRKSLDSTDINIAVSNYTKTSYEKVFVISKPTMVIYNGIDLEKYHPISEIQEEKRNRQGIRLLFIGNQSKRKGRDVVLKTMKSLSMNTIGEKIELYYTGLRNNKSQELEEYNMFCLGRLSEEDLVKEYNKADYLFFPSRLEGFGYSVVEAIACGIPVISNGGSSLEEIHILTNTTPIPILPGSRIPKHIHYKTDEQKVRIFDMKNQVIRYKLIYEQI